MQDFILAARMVGVRSPVIILLAAIDTAWDWSDAMDVFLRISRVSISGKNPFDPRDIAIPS